MKILITSPMHVEHARRTSFLQQITCKLLSTCITFYLMGSLNAQPIIEGDINVDCDCLPSGSSFLDISVSGGTPPYQLTVNGSEVICSPSIDFSILDGVGCPSPGPGEECSPDQSCSTPSDWINAQNFVIGDAVLTVSPPIVNGGACINENLINDSTLDGFFAIHTGVSQLGNVGPSANVTHKWTFSNPVCNLQFLLNDIDEEDAIIVNGKLNGVTIPLTVNDFIITNTTPDPACPSFVGNNTWESQGGCSAEDNTNRGGILITFPSCLDEIDIIYYDYSNTLSAGGSYAVGISNVCAADLQCLEEGTYQVGVTDAIGQTIIVEFIVEANNIVCERLADSLALVALYNATNGANWTNTWELTQPMDEWHGVTLNNDRRVIKIILRENNLTGMLPNLSLSELQELDLYKNQLIGEIPTYSQCINLVELILATNQLTGSIPNFNLPLLEYITLRENNLSGSIPDFDLPNLLKLHLYSNNLTGAFPNFNLPKLEELHLPYNELSGDIPDLSIFPNLTYVNLRTNQFTGAIVNFNLPDLLVLNLAENNLSGNIPSLENSNDLEQLILTENDFTGNIPNYSFSNLTHLNLRTNQLSGIIPDFNLPSLEILYLYENQLSGVLPDFDMPFLLELNVYDNYLTGTIPSFSSCDSLRFLSLSTNQFSGSIPQFNFPNLFYLSLSKNQLVGNIPNFNFPDLKTLFLYDNNFTGVLPDFSFCIQLERFEAHDNNLGDIIPDYNLQFLEKINLSNNNFVGSVPNFNNCDSLNFLSLSGNRLTGAVPDFNQSELAYLSISKNQLSGTIPDLSSLPNLKTLFLYENQFLHEEIAANYSNNSVIEIFDFSPQYYGEQQFRTDTIVGDTVFLSPRPSIPYDNPKVRWRKDGNYVTNSFALHDTTFVIVDMDTTDVGLYEYWFKDETLTPLVEFRSRPINNYIVGLDLAGEPVPQEELIIDLTEVPEEEVDSVRTFLNSIGGVVIDSCGCSSMIYLYSFDTTDIYTVIDTLGGGQSSVKASTGVQGGFNNFQANPILHPLGTQTYLPSFFEPDEYADPVVIAVLDTGMDVTHPGIQGKLWQNPESGGCYGDDVYGYNFVNKSGDVSDLHGHGTGVGGLIAESIPLQAQDIKIMPVKVYGDTLGTLFHLGCGIHYAIDNGADIISISVGYEGQKSGMLEKAMRRAEEHGIIVIPAAGNLGINIDEDGYWPAGFGHPIHNMPHVLTVAATDENGNIWEDSSYGSNTVSFATRGQNIIVPSPRGYSLFTGTSVSVPLTALTVAIEMASNKNRSYQSIINDFSASLETLEPLVPYVKEGKWLGIELTEETIMHLDIKVYLEGALNKEEGEPVMRVGLKNLNLLPMNEDTTRIAHPYINQTEGYTTDEWIDTQNYPDDIVDWVLVSIRENSLDADAIYKTPAWLLKDGTVQLYEPLKVTDTDLDELENFFVVIEHRNHLPIASDTLRRGTGTIEIDFTTQDSHVGNSVGFGQVEVSPGVWAMYAGNAVTDNGLGYEEISGADRIPWDNKNGSFRIYDSADTNLDGDINGAEVIIFFDNNGIFSATPNK